MYLDALFAKYRNNGILVDTNLLLLLVVGSYQPERILTFKRTLQYTLDDYALILRVLERFDRRIVTPNILTEVDNLARQLPAAEHDAISQVIFQIVSASFEIHWASAQVTQNDIYPKIGLADCVTMAVARDDILIVTDDFELSNRITAIGCDALNINHIRNLF